MPSFGLAWQSVVLLILVGLFWGAVAVWLERRPVRTVEPKHAADERSPSFLIYVLKATSRILPGSFPRLAPGLLTAVALGAAIIVLSYSIVSRPVFADPTAELLSADSRKIVFSLALALATALIFAQV